MSGGPFNRQARKAMAAKAKAIASQLCKTAMDYDGDGRIVRVTNAGAQSVLQRAFERMLRSGGGPQILRLSDREALSFPRGGTVPAPSATAWLAVGIDQAGMATYALRWLDVTGLDPMGQRAVAEYALLRELAVECGRPGFPVAGRA